MEDKTGMLIMTIAIALFVATLVAGEVHDLMVEKEKRVMIWNQPLEELFKK
jgi:hypothetical protein